ncbi:MAG: 50S ribosomal protein L31 [Moorea sp. SIO4E2]|uniref:50S ribosomal protein L31 n=1 Tax=Moorena sp. SIO4E2 TaxID=2607826 RepID=UPI0013BD0565|nr:50S ribosomal protein L31 [Moorena sp. SIO4E2]NEQ11790.1 50S ribosomal protein L31 [Moorena sp. SIO4E2]
MSKSNIHPKWYSKASLYHENKLLCLIGSTKNNLQIDIWLANHPFFNNSKLIVDSEGRVEKFMKKYNLNYNE